MLLIVFDSYFNTSQKNCVASHNACFKRSVAILGYKYLISKLLIINLRM